MCAWPLPAREPERAPRRRTRRASLEHGPVDALERGEAQPQPRVRGDDRAHRRRARARAPGDGSGSSRRGSHIVDEGGGRRRTSRRAVARRERVAPSRSPRAPARPAATDRAPAAAAAAEPREQLRRGAPRRAGRNCSSASRSASTSTGSVRRTALEPAHQRDAREQLGIAQLAREPGRAVAQLASERRAGRRAAAPRRAGTARAARRARSLACRSSAPREQPGGVLERELCHATRGGALRGVDRRRRRVARREQVVGDRAESVRLVPLDRSAARRCSSARAARSSSSASASATSACENRYRSGAVIATSPDPHRRLERAGRPTMSAATLARNSRPTTAAAASSAAVSAGSRATRSRITARTLDSAGQPQLGAPPRAAPRRTAGCPR